MPSHNVIDARINCKGKDYRFQTSPHPLPELRNRCEDNTSLARIPECTPFETSECGTTDNCCQCKVRTSEGTIYF